MSYALNARLPRGRTERDQDIFKSGKSHFVIFTSDCQLWPFNNDLKERKKQNRSRSTAQNFNKAERILPITAPHTSWEAS